jgi:hypothetical protein
LTNVYRLVVSFRLFRLAGNRCFSNAIALVTGLVINVVIGLDCELMERDRAPKKGT